MERDLKNYVLLDGVYFKEEQILKMAKNAGCYALAEHHLCALLAHGLIYGKREIMNMVNEVREHYSVPLIPVDDDNQTDGYRERKDSVDDKVRVMYLKMDQVQRKKVLKDSICLLRSNYHLFKYTRHWLAIFMVIRDRLEGDRINQSNFYEYATEITPDDMPQKLRISISTSKNFSREIDPGDRGEAYFDMEYNPLQELCDTFWDIVKRMVLTEK